jgi:hypothetical protein
VRFRPTVCKLVVMCEMTDELEMTIDAVAQIEQPGLAASHGVKAIPHGWAIIVGDPGRNRR